MAAPAELVKSLRDRTGAGMMDCKAALDSNNGDIEKAIDFLRKKGMASAAKRAGRDAKEGLIFSKTAGNKTAIVEINCETDFVARTDDFKNLGTLALDEALAHGEKGIESDSVQKRVAELSGKIGEKMLVKRAKVLTAQGAVYSYIHANNKLGVLVELSAKNDELGKNLAMQVAASNPICVNRTQVPAELVEREKAVYREEIKGKPENIVEKIIQGKLDKFYQNSCLMEQPFIKDDKMTVQKLVDEASKSSGSPLAIKQFVRFQLGETIA